MKTRTFLHITLTLCFFILGFIISLRYIDHKKIVTTFNQTKLTPTPTPIILNPPSSARTGQINTLSGNADIIPWNATVPILASNAMTLYQNDEIVTKQHTSATLSIGEIAFMELSENTTIVFASLLPDRITLQQTAGHIRYTITDMQTYPIAIRSKTGLIQISQGIADISTNDSTVTMTVSTGQAKIASIDSNNLTHVWVLKSGDTASINNASGNVRTTGKVVNE